MSADSPSYPHESFWCGIADHLKCGGTVTHLDRLPTHCECFCHTPEQDEL